jgi:hypothetical protein
MEGALDSSSSSSSSSASFRQHKGGMATIAAADKMIAVVGAGGKPLLLPSPVFLFLKEIAPLLFSCL